MKILKYIGIILFIVGVHPLEAMKRRQTKQKQQREKRQSRHAKDIRTLLEVQEQEISQDIPVAPPQPTPQARLGAAVKKEKVQKGKIKSGQVSNSGYHKLSILFDNSEKQDADRIDQYLNKRSSFAMPAMVLQLAELLGEKASPILVYESFILEDIFISQIASENLAHMNNVVWGEMKQNIQNTFSKIYRDTPVAKNSDFYMQYEKEFPYNKDFPQLRRLSLRTADVFPLDKMAQEWLLFEYHGQPATDRAYLLIPYNNVNQEHLSNEVLQGLLTASGFNPTVFKCKSMQELKEEIRAASDYSAYTKGGVAKDMYSFSLSVLPVVNQALKDDAMKPWLLFIVGHGIYVKDNHANDAIAGMSADVFSKGFLPLLIDKNSRFCYITSCYIGGMNRDFIREALSNDYMANDLLPEFTQMLGRRPLKYPNNLIMVLGGILDTSLNSLAPYPMPTESIESFNKAWSLIDKKDPMAMSFMPFIPSQRFDLFFDALIKHLSAEEEKGKSTQKVLISWQDVVKHIMPYDVVKGTYAYEHMPQIRFPFYDAPFNVIDVNKHVQVLRNIDVKARALGVQLKGKALEKPIIVDNKDVLVVHPLSVMVPLEIKGKVPTIVSARAGESGIMFKKIICDTSMDLQNTIHALFVYEAFPHSSIERTFLIEELRIGNSVYKDVLVSILVISPTSIFEEQHATVSVYYRTSDDKIMMYIDEQASKDIKPILEEEVSDIKDVGAEVIEQISEEDITENPYEVWDMEESISMLKEDISGKIEALKESISKEEPL